MTINASPAAASSAGIDLQVPFYIPATSPPARPRRALKHGDSFAVLDAHGDMGVVKDGVDGLYHADTRALSHLEVLINGMQPLLLGSSVRDNNTVLTVDLTNPDWYVDGALVLPKDTLHIVRTFYLWNGNAFQRLGLRNYGDRTVEVRVTIAFANDFADIFEVRGMRRHRRGNTSIDVTSCDSLMLSYEGLDKKIRRTKLSFDPPPATLDKASASYLLRLVPGERRSLFLVIECSEAGERRPMPFFEGMIRAFHDLKAATRRAATIETSNDIFNEVLCRSMADLYMLVTDTPQGPYPYAGIPWYSTTFGRDGIITALQVLWSDPRIAKGVLKRLAAHQAEREDPSIDAQPGKILHEMRSGEMAALGEIPFGLYYGSVDATPLFVLLAGSYVEYTGDLDTLRELWPNIRAAIDWIDGPGDRDRDGFVEYCRENERGLVNQGWKDSPDAIFHADGRLAEAPIALAEVQGYVFAAKRLAARCARRIGCYELAEKLDRQTEVLAARFDEAFWCPELGTYALALDARKQPCRVRTSNAGQVLFTGIARPDRAIAVAKTLLQPSFFTGWGIRTASSEELRYNPMSYHNGSIWPHDNALIALGFARYDLKAAVERVFTGLFNAAIYMEHRRLPELFCGFQRQHGRGPTLYPVACSPQAWAAATPYALLQAALGLEFDSATNEIRLRNPTLPSFLDEVLIRNLQLGQSRVDLCVRRHKTDVSLQVLNRDGEVRISALYC